MDIKTFSFKLNRFIKKILKRILSKIPLLDSLAQLYKLSPPMRVCALNKYIGKTGYILTESTPPDLDAFTLGVISKVMPFTQTSQERISELCNSVQYIVKNNIPGSIVECGVWQGGSIMAVIHTLLQCGSLDREIYLYDTFEGMSAPTAHDIDLYGTAGKVLMDSYMGFSISLETVKNNILALGYPADKIHFVKGKVEDSLPAYAPDAIALLRLDTDWYESTLHELIHLYPRITKTGVLIIDDYGHFAGCKKAVDDYFNENKTRILLNRVDYTCRSAVVV